MSTRRAALLPGLLCLSLAGTGSYLRADNGSGDQGQVLRVLVISLDGTHALDVANYIQANPHSTLAQLSATGTTYTNASPPNRAIRFLQPPVYSAAARPRS